MTAVIEDRAPSGATPNTPDRRTLVRVAGSVLRGSALEWYDYFLYGAASALVFSVVFFPNEDPSVSLLLAMATFGAGFVARPFGALVFGRIGDKHGRRPALVATLLLMGLATACMALRSDARRGGKEWASTCNSRWLAYQ